MCDAQCAFVMKMHLLNPVTTREMTAQKLEDSPDSPGELESSDRWLTLAVSPPLSHGDRSDVRFGSAAIDKVWSDRIISIPSEQFQRLINV